MKIKDCTVKIKAGPKDGLAEGQFTAYAAVFGNKDSYGDVVVEGAFTETLVEWESKGAPIPLLWGHNMADPDYNIGEILTAVEDERGLLVTAQLDLDQPKALQTYRLLKGRRVNQMSFAYDVVDGGPVAKAEDDDSAGDDYNELRALKLYEVSVVPIGANAETEILAVKTLVAGLKAGRVISAKNEGELRTAYDAIGKVLAALGNEDDQEKASGTGPANDEDSRTVKSEEPSLNPSAKTLATLSILSLT